MAKGRAAWDSRRDEHFAALRDRVRQRQESAGDVAYRLEPDLKDGHGGLRDVQSLKWANESGLSIRPEDLVDLDRCYDMLLRARVALHVGTERAGEVLRLEDQDVVASVGGWRDADDLMRDVAAAGRTIAWLVDENWGRTVSADAATVPDRALSSGIVLRDGEVELAEGADPVADPTLVLQAAVAAARTECRIGRATLDRLHDEIELWPGTWPVGATDELIALAARRAPCDPGARSARPTRAVLPVAARVGTESIHAAAQRVPPLHGRPSSLGSGGERRGTRRSRVAAGPAGARCAVPRPRQGLPGRSHRSSGWSSFGASGRSSGFRRVDVDTLVAHGRTPPPAARRGRPSRSDRRGHDQAGRRRRRHRRASRSAACADRGGLEGDRAVGVGIVEGGTWSTNSQFGYVTCWAAAMSPRSRGGCSPTPTRSR